VSNQKAPNGAETDDDAAGAVGSARRDEEAAAFRTTERESSDDAPTDLIDLRFVGPATADALAAAGVGPAAVSEKRISYDQLVEAGVNPGVAAKIRREHSLSWSFTSNKSTLARRSKQVRGLGDAERAWVAASAGDWERTATAADPAETDGSGDPTAAEAAWRDRSKPTPVTSLSVVDEAAAEALAEAGITSVRRLATADPERIADVLELDVETVAEWHRAARARRD
jgi:hypothetical protein